MGIKLKEMYIMTNEEAIEYNEYLREYMKIIDKKSEYKFLKENYKALDMANQALKQTRWTLCDERLPNEEEYKKNNGMFNVTDGNRSYSEWFDIYDRKGFGEPTMCGFRIDKCVIAWQPLPEPYKGE